MDLNKIKEVVNSGNEYWETLLLIELSKDKDVIPKMLQILDAERGRNDKLLTETNSELSRALVTIIDPNYGVAGNRGAYIDRIWVAGEIKNHYLKWQEFIKCNFKIEGLP